MRKIDSVALTCCQSLEQSACVHCEFLLLLTLLNDHFSVQKLSVLNQLIVLVQSCCTVLGGIALAQAILPIATHLSIASSVVCHIRAACLNRLTDSDATWQVHLQSPMTLCVRWGPWSLGEGEIGGQTLQPKHAIENCCCHLANGKEVIPPKCKITYLFVFSL